MPTGNTDRIWLLAGGLGAVVMLLIGWFLLIGPARSNTNALNDQVNSVENEVISLKKKLRELEEQDQNKAKYEADLAKAREALPATPNTPDFVRQLQRGGDATGVSVSDITLGEPTVVEGAVPKVYTLPITLQATGQAGELDNFLDRLQQTGPRAVLIKSTNVSVVNKEKASADLSMALSLEAYVAPTATVASPSPASTKK